MAEKFLNKYRIDSPRMQNWDYGWNGNYFITLVTKNREFYFGDIKNGKMVLSEIGKLVADEWIKTRRIRPDMNIILGEFCIMPNHFHAIIKIGKNPYNRFDNNEGDGGGDSGGGGCCKDAMHRVSTAETAETAKTKPPKNQFGPQRKNISSIIRGFKSVITIFARVNNIEFGWQPNYHDHIIRNKTEFDNIKNYIINNPIKWENDELI